MALPSLMLGDLGAVDLFRRFLPYARGFKRQIAVTASLVLVEPLLTIGLLWTGKYLVDDVLVARQLDLLALCALLYAVLMAGRIGAEYLLQRIEASIVQGITQALRADLFAHVIRLSPGSLGSEGTGSILSRLQGDTEQTEYLVYTAPLSILADVAAALFFTVALFALSWQLALCTLFALPAIAWFSYRLAPAIRRVARQSRRAEAHWMTHAEERLEALPAVQAFCREPEETSAFRDRTAKARDRAAACDILLAWQAMLIEATAALGGLGVLAFGAYLIANGAMTVGALVAFIGSVGAAYAPIRALAKATGRIQNAAAGAQRVAEVLDLPSRIVEGADAKSLAQPKGRIEFRDIAFAYPNGEDVLRGVSLTIEPGETVALVGQSGGGKSSLIRLLLRFYDPQEGRILIDGQDIRDLSLSSLRGSIASVFQDPYVVSGTIASNIRFGASGIPAARIIEAARTAAVDLFAGGPAVGLSNSVGPRGIFLSGGQRQRIALARALAKDAPILVLDEATGAVDSETEDLIQNALQTLAGTRTMLIVAHRLSSVRRADRVVVLDHGRIVECGKPDELFSSTSRARELFATQIGPLEKAA